MSLFGRFASVTHAVALVLSFLSPKAVLGSDELFVFSRPDCREELQVTPDDLEHVRQLNRERLNSSRQRIVNRQPGAAAAELRKLQADIESDTQAHEFMQSLSEIRRKRLRELVFQHRLRMGVPLKALLGSNVEISENELEMLSKRLADLKPAIEEIQDTTTFRIRTDKLSVLFGPAQTSAMVGERFEGTLPTFRRVPMFREWSDFPNLEPIKMLSLPQIQTELGISSGQIEEILALKRDITATTKNKEGDVSEYWEQYGDASGDEKIHMELQRIRNQLDVGIAEGDERRRLQYELEKVEKLKQDYLQRVDNQNRRIRKALAGILNDRQWQRLRQLIIQAGMSNRKHVLRAVEIVGVDTAGLKAEQIKKFHLMQCSDSIHKSVCAQLHDLFTKEIVSVVGKRKFAKMAGERHRFSGDSTRRSGRASNPRRLKTD